MKTERRHELQTNELADSLARWIEAIKPYSRAALALVVAVVVAIFAWGYLTAQNHRRTADAWNAYFEAMNDRDPREALGDIASTYSGTPVSEWARLTLADIQLDEGTNRLFVQKKDGRDELRQAAEKYRAILRDTRQPMLLDAPTFGLARAHEALGTPESLEEARKEYRSIGEQWPDSPYVKDASQRADDLDRASTKGFYDWLARYEPPRPCRTEPGHARRAPRLLERSAGRRRAASCLRPSTTHRRLPKFDADPSAPPSCSASTPSDDKPAAESPTEPPDSTSPRRRATVRPAKAARGRKIAAEPEREVNLARADRRGDLRCRAMSCRPSRSSWSCPRSDAGARLDSFLAQQFPTYSRVLLRKVINAAAVQGRRQARQGRPSAARRRARARSCCRSWRARVRSPRTFRSTILYEDAAIAVINKPPGMVVHPAKGHWAGTLTAALQFHFDQLSTAGGPHAAGHRASLDRDTSGVIVVAKTDTGPLAIWPISSSSARWKRNTSRFARACPAAIAT